VYCAPSSVEIAMTCLRVRAKCPFIIVLRQRGPVLIQINKSGGGASDSRRADPAGGYSSP
jgi:hypothetical protein